MKRTELNKLLINVISVKWHQLASPLIKSVLLLDLQLEVNLAPDVHLVVGGKADAGQGPREGDVAAPQLLPVLAAEVSTQVCELPLVPDPVLADGSLRKVEILMQTIPDRLRDLIDEGLIFFGCIHSHFGNWSWRS